MSGCGVGEGVQDALAVDEATARGVMPSSGPMSVRRGGGRVGELAAMAGAVGVAAPSGSQRFPGQGVGRGGAPCRLRPATDPRLRCGRAGSAPLAEQVALAGASGP